MTYLIICGIFLAALAAGDSIQQSDLQVLPQIASYRRTLAQRNIRMVQKHNSDPQTTFKMQAYPHFIGLSDEQFASFYLNNAPYVQGDGEPFSKVISLSEIVKMKHGIGKVGTYYFDVDHRNGKMRTPVNNQGKCGNCYAMAVIDGIDMMARGKDKGWPLLSTQELTECSNGYGSNKGCNGGGLYNSHQFMRSRGVHSAYYYPATSYASGVAGNCRSFPPTIPVYKIAGWNSNYSPDCLTIAQIVQNGRVVVVAITSSHPNFRYYKSGIIPDCGNESSLNHAVVLVGNTMNVGRGNYWIIKNSWGVNWGEGGYIRVSNMGTSCLLCSYTAYANV